MSNPNSFTNRDDIAELYPGKNDSSDYGLRGVSLGNSVVVTPVPAETFDDPVQLNLFEQGTDDLVAEDPDADLYDENGRAILGGRAKRAKRAIEAFKRGEQPAPATIKIRRPFEGFANPTGRSRAAFELEMKSLTAARTKRK